jgi:regulator of sirC expression with transglutaminase-like and TPR domain
MAIGSTAIYESKVKVLVTLLDDPNEEVFLEVEKALHQLPVDVVPELEKAWETSSDEILQNRLMNVIHFIQFNDIKNELKRWKLQPDADLLYGVFLIAKYQYPDLSYSIISEKINALRRDIWLEMHDHLTSLEKVRVINHVLFDLHGFTRNNSHYFAPANNFINDVLETKNGNPLSLSVIYSVLCQRLGLPVYGVNLPKNFILAYMDDEVIGRETPQKLSAVLFYINPINKGAVLGRREIDTFLTQYNIKKEEEYFYPCKNSEIVIRLLTNLVSAFDALEQHNKSVEINELLQLMKSNQ